MRKFTTIFLLGLLRLCAAGQIPNAGFENWTGGIPDNWFSQTGYSFVSPDSDAHSGYLALKFQTIQGPTSVNTTTLFTRVNSSGSFYPYTAGSIPVSVGFYAITNLVNGDVLTFNTTLKQGPNIIGVVTGTCVSTVSPSYQLYTFPINYSISGVVPDSAATWFSIRNTSCVPNSNPLNLGTYALIDDLGFDITTSIDKLNMPIYEGIYPNPVRDFLKINLHVEQPEEIELKILSMDGREILQQQFFSGAGDFTLPVDCSQIADGLYFVSLSRTGERNVYKVIVNGN